MSNNFGSNMQHVSTCNTCRHKCERAVFDRTNLVLDLTDGGDEHSNESTTMQEVIKTNTEDSQASDWFCRDCANVGSCTRSTVMKSLPKHLVAEVKRHRLSGGKGMNVVILDSNIEFAGKQYIFTQLSTMLG